MEIVLDTPRRPRAGRWAVNVLCLVVMGLALAFLLPAAMGLQRYVIMGGSMEGTYDLGSVVFEESVPVSDLEVGDVITYVPPADSGINTLVTHRIVEIDGSTFRTQGDANADVDPWTFELNAATQNRVTASLPYVGYVFIALGDRSTRMAVIGIPAAIVALASLAELLQALRRKPAVVSSSSTVEVPDQRLASTSTAPDSAEARGAGS
ncbi:MAG: signal peptidase I [Nocardioides sp.]